MRVKHLAPQFVESFPAKLEQGELYLAMAFATAAHLCACGCGTKVITPLSPTDWQMSFDGENVSLKPSVGNWTFPCRSHYWVRSGRIEWAGDMSQEEIKAGRERDAERKAGARVDIVTDLQMGLCERDLLNVIELRKSTETPSLYRRLRRLFRF